VRFCVCGYIGAHTHTKKRLQILSCLRLLQSLGKVPPKNPLHFRNGSEIRHLGLPYATALDSYYRGEQPVH
jgi:hypothetical protein